MSQLDKAEVAFAILNEMKGRYKMSPFIAYLTGIMSTQDRHFYEIISELGLG